MVKLLEYCIWGIHFWKALSESFPLVYGFTMLRSIEDFPDCQITRTLLGMHLTRRVSCFCRFLNN
eukprot:COSAG05_NODE_921_length_6590_cov_2.081985_9_plen_65_part_00